MRNKNIFDTMSDVRVRYPEASATEVMLLTAVIHQNPGCSLQIKLIKNVPDEVLVGDPGQSICFLFRYQNTKLNKFSIRGTPENVAKHMRDNNGDFSQLPIEDQYVYND